MEIDLDDNNLIGILPNDIGFFNSLESLKLSNNDISGAIPSFIGNLTMLESLNLSVNQIISMPDEMNHLTNLKFLNLTWLLDEAKLVERRTKDFV